MYAKGYHRSGTPSANGGDATLEIALEIDGVQITVPAGTSIMRAAAQAGADIPKLCATDTLRRLAPAVSAWWKSKAAKVFRRRAPPRWRPA